MGVYPVFVRDERVTTKTPRHKRVQKAVLCLCVLVVKNLVSQTKRSVAKCNNQTKGQAIGRRGNVDMHDARGSARNVSPTTRKSKEDCVHHGTVCFFGKPCRFWTVCCPGLHKQTNSQKTTGIRVTFLPALRHERRMPASPGIRSHLGDRPSLILLLLPVPHLATPGTTPCLDGSRLAQGILTQCKNGL